MKTIKFVACAVSVSLAAMYALAQRDLPEDDLTLD